MKHETQRGRVGNLSCNLAELTPETDRNFVFRFHWFLSLLFCLQAVAVATPCTRTSGEPLAQQQRLLTAAGAGRIALNEM